MRKHTAKRIIISAIVLSIIVAVLICATIFGKDIISNIIPTPVSLITPTNTPSSSVPTEEPVFYWPTPEPMQIDPDMPIVLHATCNEDGCCMDTGECISWEDLRQTIGGKMDTGRWW